MCEVAKGQRRAYRDQDPPRICQRSADSSKDEAEFSKSAPNSQGTLQRAASLGECFGEPEFVAKDRENRGRRRGESAVLESGSPDSGRGGSAKGPDAAGQLDLQRRSTATENLLKELANKAPSSARRDEVITNGLKGDADSCDGLTNGRTMAPVLGVPPPPPPAPHMGPDGLILPRKPYNPYLTSNNHKDLRRELLFNQKVGRSVLNQKSELQRALEKQREAASRREAERNRDESYKDDPRTALQRALEQRAKHIEMALEQSQPTMEQRSNLLVTARAKLRPRTDSQ